MAALGASASSRVSISAMEFAHAGPSRFRWGDELRRLPGENDFARLFGRDTARDRADSPAPAETAGAKRASCGSRGLAIDVAFGKGGELAVRGLLLLQILFEQPGAVRPPQLLGPRNQRAVARHLVVLDRLSCGNQGRIEHVLVVDLACDVVRL